MDLPSASVNRSRFLTALPTAALLLFSVQPPAFGLTGSAVHGSQISLRLQHCAACTLSQGAAEAATYKPQQPHLIDRPAAAHLSSSGLPGASAQGQSGERPAPASPSEQPQKSAPISAYHLSPEKYAQAIAYSRARYRLYFISTAYELLVLFLVLHWKWAAKFRNYAARHVSRRFLQAGIFTPLLVITLSILNLPTGIYSHWLSLSYDQSVQRWGSWALDWGKEQIMSVVFGAFLVWILYAVIRRSPRRWWLYFWVIALPIMVFLVFVEPLVIEPLFFKFEPLQSTQPQLTREISKVLDHAGMEIPSSHMFEMRASEKLKELNAYVTGIGASKRVVVWDTTISSMTIPQTLSVFGHEMGHYVLGHIWKGIAFSAAVLLVFLYLSSRMLAGLLRRWGPGWGVRGLDDLASLPAILLVAAILMFFGSPVLNAFSRYQEHQADIYGLEVIHGVVPDSQQVTAQGFQILGEIDLADPHPNPFINFWLYSHPPLADRLNFALHYDPWGEGRGPEFVK